MRSGAWRDDATARGRPRPGTAGASQLLLEAEFVANDVAPAAGYDPVAPPPWFRELSAAQRAVVGPRLAGLAATESSEPAASTAAAPPPPTAEGYLWELHGFLVVPGVMDASWLAAANGAVTACAGHAATQVGTLPFCTAIGCH